MKKYSTSFFLLLTAIIIISKATATTTPTSPDLGTAAAFGVLTSTYTNGAAWTTINADLGYIYPPVISPTSMGDPHIQDDIYDLAVSDQNIAFDLLNSQDCTFTFAAGAIELPTDATHWTVGVYTPGVYCVSAAANITTGITLSGTGTYIFRITGALATAASSSVTLTDWASADDVWWTTGWAIWLGANTTFIWNGFSSTITVGANTSWIWRAFSLNGTITTGADSMITAPVFLIPYEVNQLLDLWVAETFGVLTSTYVNGAVWTTINGDMGYIIAPTVASNHPNEVYINDETYTAAGLTQSSALATLNSQACTHTFTAGAVVLSTYVLPGGTAGVYPPGIYCITGAASIWAAGITLNGGGAYVFRLSGAITTAVNANITLSNGASPGDIWWIPGWALSLGVNNTFVWTAFSDAIIVGAGTFWTWRALAFGGTITTEANSIITVPTMLTYKASIHHVEDASLDYIWEFITFPGSTPPVFGLAGTWTINSNTSIVTGFTVLDTGDYTIQLSLIDNWEIVSLSANNFTITN